MINAQCAFDKSCVNQQCVDPCPGICGLHAMCRAVNHNPICSCLPGYTGDPFTRCVPNPEPSKSRLMHIDRRNIFISIIFDSVTFDNKFFCSIHVLFEMVFVKQIL